VPFPRAAVSRLKAGTTPFESTAPEIRHAALGGRLDAFLEVFGGAQFGLFFEFMIGGGEHASARPARMVARVEIRPSGEHSAISCASFIASVRTWSCGTQTLASPSGWLPRR